jgi:hypothetical protein
MCSAPAALEDDQAILNSNVGCTIRTIGGQSDAWLTPSSECDWGGLACDDENFLMRIDFGAYCEKDTSFLELSTPDVFLTKQLSPWLSIVAPESSLFVPWHPLALACHRLPWSSIEENGIAGTLPVELNRLQSLRFLLLEEGVLTGTIPLQLGDIRALEEIDLNFNLLQGPIPESLYSLTNLRQFDVNDNELSGTISTRIGQLAKLSFFQIEQNKFSGTLPTELGKLSMLGELLRSLRCVCRAIGFL